jgi:hypothetical protein
MGLKPVTWVEPIGRCAGNNYHLRVGLQQRLFLTG